MKARPYSVFVLHDAPSKDARPDELDGLVQVKQVAEAVTRLGWWVSVLPTSLDLASTLAAIQEQHPSCVFNLVESLGGDGRMIHFVPAMLDASGIPYTGSNSDAMYLSSQKLLAKNLMRQNGIPVPGYFTSRTRPEKDGDTWIIKSLWEHASFGMDDGCVVSGIDAAIARMDDSAATLGGDWFAEEYLDGREFNISVLEHKGQPYILPIAEMNFDDYPQGKPRIVGYAAKWDESAPEYVATRRSFPALPDALRNQLNEIVRQCWSLFGLQGYARVDLRLDTTGNALVLEVNANPCLSKDAGFAAAAKEAGISYRKLIERVVRAALRPALRTFRRTG